jgi:hypothetical protein
MVEGATGATVVCDVMSAPGGSIAAGARVGRNATISIGGGIIVGGAAGAKVCIGSMGRGVSAAVTENNVGASARDIVGGIINIGVVLDDTDWGASDGEASTDMVV